MPQKDPAKPKYQHKAFKETARAHECDESEAAFDKALKKLGQVAGEKPQKGR